MGGLEGDVVLIRDRVEVGRAPGQLGGDVLEGCGAAVVFVSESEDGVQPDLGRVQIGMSAPRLLWLLHWWTGADGDSLSRAAQVARIAPSW